MNAAKEDQVLVHYGVPGMKWGVRRYQNYDGTLIGSRPRTTREKLQRWKTKQIKKGDPTSEAMAKAMRGSNSKLLKKAAQSYDDRKVSQIAKSEAKERQLSKQADQKYAEKMAKNNPIYYKSKTMSDDDLRKQIARLNLEQQYRDSATRDIYNAQHFVQYSKKYQEKNFAEKFAETAERDLTQELGREFSKEILKKMALTAATGV